MAETFTMVVATDGIDNISRFVIVDPAEVYYLDEPVNELYATHNLGSQPEYICRVNGVTHHPDLVEHINNDNTIRIVFNAALMFDLTLIP